jgi:serine/threonine protein kinase
LVAAKCAAQEGMDIRDDTKREARSGGQRLRHPPVEVRPGDILTGRFVVGEVLGVGATGTVFSALDQAVGQKVAIKILHPDLNDDRNRERLRREVRAARSGHPNLVPVFDLYEGDGHVFLSMELVEGRSLKMILKELGRLETDEVVRIGRQIAAALDHLHAQGVIHRDIKPGNILLTPDGTAKLCDMGLARPLEEGMTVTETEMVVGTPAYMAPEQGLGNDLTAASDLYGLGLTLYQCLTGSVPLTSETAVATLTRRQRERPPAVRKDRPGCPAWLDRLIRRMLEPRPGDRPSAARVARACETTRVWPRPRKRSVAMAGLVAVLVAAAAFVGWSSVSRRTVGFDYDQYSVFGLDHEGKKTWTHEVSSPPREIEAVDLDGDGRDEVVATGPPPTDGHERPPADRTTYLTILNDRGRVISSVVLEDLIGGWEYPYRLDVHPILSFEDLDGDGRLEVVVNCRHQRFYPAVLLAYWPRWSVWETLLHHPGSLIAIGAAHESGRPGIRFVAYNNLLGMIKVYGEIELVPPGSGKEGYGRPTRMVAPPDLMSRKSTVGSWRAYVPFAEGSASPYRDEKFVITREPELIVGLADRGPVFDHLFNPLDGPNRGRDLREARLRFAESLSMIGARTRAITLAGVEELMANIRSDAGPLMDEVPYNIVFSTLAAKTLAGAGDLEAGIALLEETRLLKRDDNLLFRLAHLYALGGELTKAREILVDTANQGTTARAGYDVPLLMLQIAIVQDEERDVAAAVGYLTDRSKSPHTTGGLRNSLAARARLWRDAATPTDAQVHTVDVDGDGDAVACLVRWRLGIPARDEVERMRASIDHNPDGFKLGTIALAAVLIDEGSPGEALVELDRVIGAVARSSKWDFTDAQIMGLAWAVRVVALEAAGDFAAASAEAARLAPELDPDLLPGILVREVLDRTNT